MLLKRSKQTQIDLIRREIKMNENNFIIRAKDLHKTFGKGETAQVVLDGAQLDIEKGNFVSLMGESGRT